MNKWWIMVNKWILNISNNWQFNQIKNKTPQRMTERIYEWKIDNWYWKSKKPNERWIIKNKWITKRQLGRNSKPIDSE